MACTNRAEFCQGTSAAPTSASKIKTTRILEVRNAKKKRSGIDGRWRRFASRWCRTSRCRCPERCRKLEEESGWPEEKRYQGTEEGGLIVWLRLAEPRMPFDASSGAASSSRKLRMQDANRTTRGSVRAGSGTASEEK